MHGMMLKTGVAAASLTLLFACATQPSGPNPKDMTFFITSAVPCVLR